MLFCCSVVQLDPSHSTEPRHVLSRHSLPITDIHCGLMGAQARVATASLDQTVKVSPVPRHTQSTTTAIPETQPLKVIFSQTFNNFHSNCVSLLNSLRPGFITNITLPTTAFRELPNKQQHLHFTVYITVYVFISSFSQTKSVTVILSLNVRSSVIQISSNTEQLLQSPSVHQQLSLIISLFTAFSYQSLSVIVGVPFTSIFPQTTGVVIKLN